MTDPVQQLVIFFHGFPGDYKTATNETIRLFLSLSGGLTTAMDPDCMLVQNGVPLSSFGFINQLLKFRGILPWRQLL